MVNAAGLEPKFTAVTPLKLLPVMMTEVPPFEGPLEGESDVIVGITGGVGEELTYVN